MIQINGTKIANGDVKESMKILFLTNPVGFKILLRQQGVKVGRNYGINELNELIDQVKTDKKRINFNQIIKALPITDEMTAQGRLKYIVVGMPSGKPATNEKLAVQLNLLPQ